MRLQRTIGLISIMFCVALLLGGCASAGGRGAKASQGLMGSASLLRQGSDQVGKTIESMQAMRTMSGKNLTKLYKGYRSNVNKLDSIANKVKATNNAMVREGKRYFDKWDRDLAKIKNEDLKTASAQRQQEVRESLDQIAAGYGNLSTDYASLMSNLQDILTALKVDLTANGVNAVAGVMQEAESHAKAVQSHAEETAQAYESLGVQLSDRK